jgi:hypothetical protein
MREVWDERKRQDERWGEQNHPDGTDAERWTKASASNSRILCDRAAKEGKLTFRHVLAEETAEAFAEIDPDKLRAELVQVAAVVVCWIESIDRRSAQKEGA